MDTVSKFIIPIILFLLTLASGFWVSRGGKPYNTAIFTIHKLIALGMVIVTGIQTYNLLKGTGVQGLLIALVILAGLCVIALFASGALMSAGKSMPAFLLTIHQIAPFLVAISMALAVYLLAVKKP